ncbi:MAG: sulfatase-like hydrolase/transferase [Rhodospirillaceae bacterium]|jgi:arylsulfatase A-like enzyme|nr:sulfatase-like hydrolase/transferase [Rhodospirillaceae bacterium]MBT7646150.1 sulfatase-like hydrolase/transferase [Rhodospirillaceae bacterium]
MGSNEAKGDSGRPNILFIMADQLRADYLGCAGHPELKTPAIDALAARGVRFTSAYVQAPVCGGSRNSTYTGRYAFSHGGHGNSYALRPDEMGIGDYLRPQGYRVALAGKTHFVYDEAAFARLGLDAEEGPGALAAEIGFEPFERDDGLYPEPLFDPHLAYNRFLWDQGYRADHPWHEIANAAEGPGGEVLSGWLMRYAHLPARVHAEHSETAWMTDRAMEFVRQAGDQPWCLHLSYIKPHWPYIAAAPWNDLYRDMEVPPANRDDAERADPNPVYAAFMDHWESKTFSESGVRENVLPTYLGLIAEVDHHIGRMMTFLEEQGMAENTVVVFTSDHGDYLGDHWLGEKDLYHEEIVKVPLIIADPREGADATRGGINDAFVEAIDLAPTFLEMSGGEAMYHRLEGRSLAGQLAGDAGELWRDCVFSDGCFGKKPARVALGLSGSQARSFMVRTREWKYTHFQSAPPMLFDLVNDPEERRDLGHDPAHTAVRSEMKDRMFDWMMNRRLRVTTPDTKIEAATAAAKPSLTGWPIGMW